MEFRSFIVALHAALLCILLAASPAGSGSMTLLGVGKAGGGGGGPPTLTYITTPSGGGATFSGNSVIFVGTSIGTASSDRFLIVSWSGAQPTSGNTVTALTLKVAGQTDITFTMIGNLSTANGVALIGYAAVPAAYGTTGDLWITNSVGWGFVPLVSTYTTLISTLSSQTPTGSNAVDSASATSINTTLNTTTGGFIVAVGSSGTVTGGASTITGTETYTADAVVNLSRNFAHASPAGTNAGNSVTLTQVGAADFMDLAVAAWR